MGANCGGAGVAVKIAAASAGPPPPPPATALPDPHYFALSFSQVASAFEGCLSVPVAKQPWADGAGGAATEPPSLPPPADVTRGGGVIPTDPGPPRLQQALPQKDVPPITLPPLLRITGSSRLGCRATHAALGTARASFRRQNDMGVKSWLISGLNQNIGGVYSRERKPVSL